ncbi:hypothetical protein AURDEDRAFT_174169 [Auricularia subglabra TFB-10046 SS5]|nr:hypothetical protein AURDEDRAFT_174169 [Auricularia subglabra TFB-10046 SS5]
MQRLHLAGGAIDFDAPVPPLAAERLARLEYMDLEYCDEIATFLQYPCTAALPIMSVAFATPPVVQAALAGLKHPLQLSMSLYRGNEFHISVTAADGRRRVFPENPGDYEGDEVEPNSILKDTELAASSAFRTLVISTALWVMLHPYLPSFGHLVTLAVWIEDTSHDIAELSGQAIPCPRLQTLALCSKPLFSYVEVEAILRFADSLTVNLVELELVRVLPVGSTELLTRRFVRTNTRDEPSLVWWPEKHGIDW